MASRYGVVSLSLISLCEYLFIRTPEIIYWSLLFSLNYSFPSPDWPMLLFLFFFFLFVCLFVFCFFSVMDLCLQFLQNIAFVRSFYLFNPCLYHTSHLATGRKLEARRARLCPYANITFRDIASMASSADMIILALPRPPLHLCLPFRHRAKLSTLHSQRLQPVERESWVWVHQQPRPAGAVRVL